MIGIDTNVLLRFILHDDVAHSRIARRFFESVDAEKPAYINTIVLIEFIWTARRRIKMTRQELIAVLSGFLDSTNIVLEDEPLVELALDEMIRSGEEFTDVFLALKNINAGCDHTATFDARAAKAVPGMELLA
ncbi:PIN domain-containing protein [Pararhizobium gei]|uniref:PIN domain-containing protein n=1 Tax=Pararhizobium gei TaxID=1395951 RepID=UPI0023DCCDEA|nr:type II toxin-antitoxin system VapC family toxin [Rhizobium gei]